LQHLGAVAERRDDLALLVRRAGGRDEPDLIEAALLATLLGQDEMPEVNGVEGAAEDADAHNRLLLSYDTAVYHNARGNVT
jgi:hypothetical protein